MAEPVRDPAPALSLLWPPGLPVGDAAHRPYRAVEPSAIADLGLDELAKALTIGPRYAERVREVLYTLVDDPAVIVYRQEVLDDLLRRPDLVIALEAILPRILEIGQLTRARRKAESPLHQIIWRLGELEVYGDAMQLLDRALTEAGDELRSRGLLAWREAVARAVAEPSFRSLMAELPGMRSALNALRSVTVGINLDPLLRPVSATLLSINDEEFSGRSVLNRLLGRRDENEGLGPLHGVPSAQAAIAAGLHPDERLFMSPLFQDMERLIRDVVRPVADALSAYVNLSGGLLIQLEWDIVLYLGSVRLIRRLEAQGLPTCRPEIAPGEAPVGHIEGLYNVLLALRLAERRPAADLPSEIVLNDVTFGDEGRVWILTGPNRGGKTTYTQAVGQAQVLAQAGLHTPGRRARLSLVDGIYTHFPVAEKLTLEAGRLGEEAQRLSAIFRQATRRSLILLNESLFSTSPGESLYLARDIVRALRDLGARAIYATHLHELAANLEAINAEAPGAARVVSLVAGVEQAAAVGDAPPAGETVRRTYRITPGPPLGLSYAREIAARYGISYEALREVLRRRGPGTGEQG